MSKFKVGDKVKVVHVYVVDAFPMGIEGKIVDINPVGAILVEFADGVDEWVSEKQLELVPEDIQNWWETPEGFRHESIIGKQAREAVKLGENILGEITDSYCEDGKHIIVLDDDYEIIAQRCEEVINLTDGSEFIRVFTI